MPKALTASLPIFDGKSEKFELFEDLFRNSIKMYPISETVDYFRNENISINSVDLWESIGHKTSQKAVDKTVKIYKNCRTSQYCSKSAICIFLNFCLRTFKKILL